MSIDPVEQKVWVEQCQQGDRKAQQRLYEAHYGKMLGVCMRYATDIDQAKDILQDGFIKVFNSLERFNHSGSLEGWIRRIMVNTAIDLIRKEKRSKVLSKSEERIDESVDIVQEDFSEDNEGQQLSMTQVVEAMQHLSPGYRAVFNLYVMEDMTHKEISAKLGISEGTSKSNLSKAKLNLKRILSEQGQE